MECESCTHQTLLPAELAFLRTFASPIEVPTATTVGESVRGWPKVSLTQKRDPDLTPSAVFQSRLAVPSAGFQSRPVVIR